jgi:putative toxin-antitoxin system antitoxin component (TIGR02293 family)
MTQFDSGASLAEPENKFQQVSKLLGGQRLLKHRVTGPLDAHALILDGIPGAALMHLIDRLTTLDKSAAFENAVGMSMRTFQRRKSAPANPLSPEQSARTWKFAQVLSKASDIFGSQTEAEQWMLRPATGLDQHKPIELLATPAGTELVEDFLERLEYGVYM